MFWRFSVWIIRRIFEVEELSARLATAAAQQLFVRVRLSIEYSIALFPRVRLSN